MEKNSEREVSELLKQLEEFVEKDKASKATKSTTEAKTFDLSVEELLDQLEQSAGTTRDPDEGENNLIGEYDIASNMEDFIALEEETVEVESETATIEMLESSENVERVEDASAVLLNEIVTLVEEKGEENLPEFCLETENEADIVSCETIIKEQSANNNLGEALSLEEEAVIIQESSEEESLRKQVEAFVLETLDPEEENSILDSIAGIAARNKEIVNKDADSKVEGCMIIEELSESEVSEDGEEIEELPCDYARDGMMSRFFHKDISCVSQNDEESLDFDYKDFNDVDINLALALGCEEELHESFGFSRVRASKNGFHDPAEETPIASSVFAGDGKEFRSYEQIEDIKLRYKREKKLLYKRFACTFALTVFILFFEHIFLTDISIPYVTDFFAVSWRYYLVSVLLSALCVACSIKRLLGGCGAILSMTPNPYTPPAAFAFLNLLYEVIVLVVYPDEGLLTYNFVLAIFLLFAIVNEYMRLIRDNVTFDVISDGKPKLSLERFEGEGELKKDGSYLGRHDFFVEKVSFVGNYFSRIGKIPMRQRIYGLAYITIILAGAVMMLISASVSRNLGNAFQTFFFWMMLCVPMQYLVLGSYPFYLLSKGLKKVDSAILGEGVVDEYAITDTIYLGDDEMFGRHGASVSGLRLYGDMDFYELLYYAFAVFSHLGAPLCHIFDTSTKEIPKPKEVKINTVSVGGIEATVDGEHKVLVGNIAFIRSKGFFPKRNLDDEKKVESGQTSIAYIAIDGTLCSKLYIKYTITKRFEKFVQEMVSNEISVGIRTLDPSVNARMISILREHKEPDIQVIHPTANELVAVGKHSDSGIITGKNSHMIFRILQQCLHIRNVHKRQTIFYLLSILLGIGGVVALALTNTIGTIPSLFVAVYHIIWVIIGTIYTKSKLK